METIVHAEEEVRSDEVRARAFPLLPRETKSMTYATTALELLGSFDGGGGGAAVDLNKDNVVLQ